MFLLFECTVQITGIKSRLFLSGLLMCTALPTVAKNSKTVIYCYSVQKENIVLDLFFLDLFTCCSLIHK